MNQLEGRLAKIEKAVNNFGGLVYEFRVENALSLQDMAEVVSLSPSYLWRIENARRKPDLDVRVRILNSGMNWSTVDIHLYLEQIIAKKSATNKTC